MESSAGAISRASSKEEDLKVLYFSSATHLQGGAVQSMFRNARWLEKEHGQALVVLPRHGPIVDWYEREGVEVVILPFVEIHRRRSPFYLMRYVFSTISIILRLTALIRGRGIDIVHVNEILYWPGLVAGKLAGSSTICHVRVILKEPVFIRKALAGIAQSLSDEVLCVSQAVRQQMFPADASNVRVLYNQGPDLDRFDPCAADGNLIREELGIDADAFVVGLVSKFTLNKGHLALIEAARAIEEDGRHGDFVYLLVGGKVPDHESYHARVNRMIDRYGLRESFILTGVRNDIPKVIAACDVLVHLPLHEDPLPNVVFEGLAMARPVVAFSSGGIPEQFEHGASGVLLDKNDIQGLANTLLDLSTDRNSRRRMGKEGRRFLVSHFSANRFFSELGEVYMELSAG